MTASDVIQALEDGKILDDESGRKFHFDGIVMRVEDGHGWLPTSLDATYILTRPYVFKEVSE